MKWFLLIFWVLSEKTDADLLARITQAGDPLVKQGFWVGRINI